MAIDYERLISLKIPDVEQEYTYRDTILYALSVGAGESALDERELRFVYEEGLMPIPTFAATLAHPGFWLRDLDTGVDWLRVVHGEQQLTLHAALPAAASVVGRTEVVDIIDKGVGKGAIIISRRTIRDLSTGDLLASMDSASFCRADGGFGGPIRITSNPPPLPERQADHIIDTKTLPQAALLYRLNGDGNPIHADPRSAAAAGFPRPILHGLATYGMACWAVLKCLCDYQPERLASFTARFSAPVFPGETLRTEIWREGSSFAFRTSVQERAVVALQNGRGLLN